jgi:hypothetical protein
LSCKEHRLSELDKWILGFLTIAEHGRIPDKPHSGGGGVMYGKMTTNPFQLAAIIPPSILSEIGSLSKIRNTLDGLVKNGLLENVPPQGHTEEMKSVSITVDGIICYRNLVRPIAQAIKTDEYEKTIDRAEGEPALKEKLKTIKDKLKDKAEDFVINEIFKIVRTTGYTYE